MSIEPNMHGPDWGRYQVAPQGRIAPVGDPTRWGAQVFTRVQASAVVGEGNIYSGQILSLATRDGYARAWSILGTLTLPGTTWLLTGSEILCFLECTLGVGQVQITQSIALFASFGPAASKNVGLCETQYVLKGGPYYGVDGEPVNAVNPGSYASQTRAFAAVGALVGQSIAIRARYMYNGSPLANDFPFTSRLALIVTPYAAGEGL